MAQASAQMQLWIIPNIVMAHVVMVIVVMAHIVMVHNGQRQRSKLQPWAITNIVVAIVVMAYIVMAHNSPECSPARRMACSSSCRFIQLREFTVCFNLHSYGPSTYCGNHPFIYYRYSYGTYAYGRSIWTLRTVVMPRRMRPRRCGCCISLPTRATPLRNRICLLYTPYARISVLTAYIT